MTEDSMLKFVTHGREMPASRAVSARKKDFDEIYKDFSPETLAVQASRCSQCGVPFCQRHCPLHNNIPDWLHMAATGRMREAWEISNQTNVFPEICGRICPQDRLCEGSCVIEQAGHGTVTIGAIEHYITDYAWQQGWIEPVIPAGEEKQSIGIIGAGPAGLSAAADLRRHGYRVEIYEAYDRPGGLMIYGIPNFKLDKEIVLRRTEWLKKSGVVFHTNCRVGKDVAFAELRQKHDALLMATGAYKTRPLGLKDENAEGVIPALDYLIASNKQGLGDSVADFEAGKLNANGKTVLVVGGGDTAMDCVRTAIRQGAKSVQCLYRRDRENMPGSAREVANAEAEGVGFNWLRAPEKIITNKKIITSLKAQTMQLSMPDQTGRKKAVPVSGVLEDYKLDMLLVATGFEVGDVKNISGDTVPDVNPWKTVRVTYPDMATSLEGVFAAGDVVRGASLVVWAIREGRDAAMGIHCYLKAQSATHKEAQSEGKREVRVA